MKEELKIVTLKGKEVIPYIPDLAKLRIEIFKDYPYLYEGDLEYEANYLKRYAECLETTSILVFDKDKVVGVSTSIPLEFELQEFQQPFVEKKINIKDVFLFGESILLPKYRGRNIYPKFFQAREAAARKYGCKIATFFAVERTQDDPRRPKDYKPLDVIWERYGYKKHPELCAYFEWKEIGEDKQSPKPLVFWLKTL